MVKNDFPHPAFPVRVDQWHFVMLMTNSLLIALTNYEVSNTYLCFWFNILILNFNSSSGIAFGPTRCLWYSSCNTTASCAGPSLSKTIWKVSISSSLTSSYYIFPYILYILYFFLHSSYIFTKVYQGIVNNVTVRFHDMSVPINCI